MLVRAPNRHLLVLDTPDRTGLAAAALLVIAGERAHLAMLVIAGAFQGRGLDERIIGVAEAMARAYGAGTLDVPTRRVA